MLIDFAELDGLYKCFINPYKGLSSNSSCLYKGRIAKCDSKLGVKPKTIPQLGSKAKVT